MSNPSPEPFRPVQPANADKIILVINTNVTGLSALYLATSSVPVTIAGAGVCVVASVTHLFASLRSGREPLR
jgi:hypothetical protein